jgi:hypothetical protein
MESGFASDYNRRAGIWRAGGRDKLLPEVKEDRHRELGSSAMPEGPIPPAPTAGKRRSTVAARTRSRYELATRRAEQTWRQVEASRDRAPHVDIALQVYERDRDVAGPLLAGAIAFRIFLWLIPFTLAMVVVLSFVSDISTRSPDQVAREAGLGGYLVTTVAHTTATSNQARWTLAVAGLWALMLASRSLTKALRASHALAWRMRFPRGGITRLTLKVGGTFAGLAAASMTAAALRAGPRDRACGSCC